MKNTKRIYNVIKAILVIAFIILINKYINVEFLQAKIAASGPLAPIVYVICFTILPALLVPTLTLVVVAGTLFGFVKGILLTLVGVITNTSLMYIVGNRYAKDKIYDKLKDKLSKQYFDLIYTEDQKKLLVTFFISRLIPAIPYIFENYLAGLTEIKFLPYLITTVIGVIPGMMIYLNVGTNIGDVKSKDFLYSVILLVAFTVFTLAAKKLYDRRHGDNNNTDL